MRAVLSWCARCKDYTYHRFNSCMRCLQVRQAGTRTKIIIAACAAAFIVAVAKIWWSR